MIVVSPVERSVWNDMSSRYVQRGLEDVSTMFANYAQQGDPPIIITITAVSLFFIHGDYCSIVHILRYLAFSLTKTQELVRRFQ